MATPRPASRPLRILLVANLYPSAAHPAFGTFVGGREDALRAAGHRVDVAAITDDRAHLGVARKYLRLAIGAVWAALRSRLRRRRYDVVEAHIAFPTGLVAWPAARIAGSPLALFVHGSDVTVLPWSSQRRERAARWLFARADLVVANSRYTADLAELRLGPLRRPVVVASPGIQLPTEHADETGAVRAADHIVFVGRLVPGKGAEVLVDAMGRVLADGPPARLTIVGDGELRPALEERAAPLGAAVGFAGPLPPAAVADLLREATVVAVPATQPEGLGLVALEAMAAGALVVGTAVGGQAETVRDGENGVVVPPDDAAALAAALRHALAIAPTAAGDRLRAAGRATAAAHDRRTAVDATVEAFRELGG